MEGCRPVLPPVVSLLSRWAMRGMFVIPHKLLHLYPLPRPSNCLFCFGSKVIFCLGQKRGHPIRGRFGSRSCPPTRVSLQPQSWASLFKTPDTPLLIISLTSIVEPEKSGQDVFAICHEEYSRELDGVCMVSSSSGVHRRAEDFLRPGQFFHSSNLIGIPMALNFIC